MPLRSTFSRSHQFRCAADDSTIFEAAPTKNKDLSPAEVLSSSGTKAWRLCRKCNFEWETNVFPRRCPIPQTRSVPEHGHAHVGDRQRPGRMRRP
ncbi:zinc-ribbon domain-containing protein [Nocardia sp. NPDC059154]|uniref:zinc-ribbon domain-containing protein n=1 Tax=Nocardia sp. NPDC059154 TaxID=3346744 RepID=UPI0036C34FE9